MFQRRPAMAGVLAAALLAGLLAAACTHQPARPPRASVGSCTRSSVSALRHRTALTSLPAACQGLSRHQLYAAADAAVRTLAGTVHGKNLRRARMRELSPLLPPLASAARQGRPAVSGPAGTGPGLPLGLAALAAWLVTAGLGLLLMARWLTRGGLRRLPRARVAMNLAHLGLSLAGLAAWAGYLVTGAAALAWAGCAALMPVTGLGMSLLLLRTPWRRRLPAFTVAAHVALAVVTLLLVLLAAVGSG
ncbi:MAG: hypothetical protein ACM32E_12025 [Gemmatimonadota bacterium]